VSPKPRQPPGLALLTAACAAMLAGACASNPPARPGAAAPSAAPPAAQAPEQKALERYSAYAGAPIDSFTWLGRFYSWQALGRDRLVVFTTPNDAYLLKVWSSCDLRFVMNTIGVTSTASTVSAHLDAVKIDSAPTGRMTCPIEEIRRVDYRRMSADLRAQPAAGSPPPPNQAAPPNPPPPGQ